MQFPIITKIQYVIRFVLSFLPPLINSTGATWDLRNYSLLLLLLLPHSADVDIFSPPPLPLPPFLRRPLPPVAPEQLVDYLERLWNF